MARWLKENNQDKAIKMMLFLVSPFLSFLYALRRIKTKSSYVIILLTFLFFGICFSVPRFHSEKSFDGTTYRIDFESFKYLTTSQFYDGLISFLTFNEGKKDYYFDTLAFYISRFSDNYHVLFLFAALIFSFFSLKSFLFFTQEDKFDASLASYLLAYLFMFNQIFNINGMRMWTAAWVAVFAILHLFGKGEKRYIFLLLITPFFHGAFWVLITIVVIAIFLMRYDKVWSVLWLFSFFTSSVIVEIVQDASDYLPFVLQKMVAYYTDNEYLQLRKERGSGYYWVPRLFGTFVRTYVTFIIFLLIKNSAMIKANPKTTNLSLFLLVYATLVNILMPIPSLGGRFFVLAYPIIAYIWLIHFKGVMYQAVLYLFPFVFGWSLYKTFFRDYMTVTPIDFFVGSPFYLIYKYLLA